MSADHALRAAIVRVIEHIELAAGMTPARTSILATTKRRISFSLKNLIAAYISSLKLRSETMKHALDLEHIHKTLQRIQRVLQSRS